VAEQGMLKQVQHDDRWSFMYRTDYPKILMRLPWGWINDAKKAQSPQRI